jgi:hypothetical protein
MTGFLGTETGAREAPTNSREAVAALQKWAEILQGPSRKKPFVLQRRGEKLILRGDSAEMGQKRARFELEPGRLQLDVRGRKYGLWLKHFDAVMSIDGRCFAIEFKRRAPREASSLSDAIRGATEALHLDLPGGLERILDTLESTVFQRALVVRAINAIADVTASIDDQIAAQVLSASSDEMALLRLLEQPDVLETLRASDPLAPARIRGVTAKNELIDRAGGTLSSDDVARALHLTRQAVDKRRRAGRLLALSLGRRGYRYPAFQFDDGGLLAGFERVLVSLKDHDPWTKLAFFVTGRSDLDDQTAVQRLRAGDLDAVLRAASTLGEHGAA